jgi:hypothetical protein
MSPEIKKKKDFRGNTMPAPTPFLWLTVKIPKFIHIDAAWLPFRLSKGKGKCPNSCSATIFSQKDELISQHASIFKYSCFFVFLGLRSRNRPFCWSRALLGIWLTAA